MNVRPPPRRIVANALTLALFLAVATLSPLAGAAPKSSGSTPPADLTASAWHSPPFPREGDPVSIGVSVHNAGGTKARVSVLDVLVDGAPYLRLDVPELAPGTSFVHSFSLVFSAGDHSVGAIADATGRLREPDEANNRATDTFPVARRLPDLSISSASSSPSAAWTDTPVTLYVTVTNNGDAVAAASTLSVALDDGSSFRLALPELAAGAWSSLSQPVGMRPVGTTTVSLTADADNVVEERNEANNGASHSFAVQERRPELVVVGATNGPQYGGDPLRFVVGVRNQGEVAAPATVLRAHWDDGEPPMDLAFPSLGPGETLHIGVWRDAPATEGTHEVRFDADATLLVAEWDESNNSYVHAFTVVPPQPDLVVHEVRAEPANGTSGTQTLVATIYNAGSATAGASTMRLELQGQIYEEAVPGLLRGTGVDVAIAVPSDPLGYNVTAEADAGGAVTELDEGNNVWSRYVHADGRCWTLPECRY